MRIPNQLAILHTCKNGSAASAFIPFCAFEGQLKISAEVYKLPNLSFPICRSFIPTSLDGQLCYKLQVNKTTKGSDNREGLILILDMNEDMLFPLGSPRNTKENNDPINFSLNMMSTADKSSAKIYIKIMSGFKSFGPGSYRMTSMKRLKGTNDFLSMSQVDRKCSLTDFEDCRRKALFQKCNCVPWELGSIQVSDTKYSAFLLIRFQEGPLCSPEGRLCIDNISKENFGCQISCEGLYADVTKYDVVENEQYKKIEEEYLNYKKRYFKNIQFNGSAPHSYGKH